MIGGQVSTHYRRSGSVLARPKAGTRRVERRCPPYVKLGVDHFHVIGCGFKDFGTMIDASRSLALVPVSLYYCLEMGDAKRRKAKTAAFIREHPYCAYCGAPATTRDHCPPRCFFENRQAPEEYEFPACKQCNAEARLDEQALGALIRVKLGAPMSEMALEEFQKLVSGVKNNQPKLAAEWQPMTPAQLKREMRAVFGAAGDGMRHKGWGMLSTGPLTEALVNRFIIKIGKSLFYRYNHQIFDGVIYLRHITFTDRDATPQEFSRIVEKAPLVSDARRNGKSLRDQFIYRFNYSPEHRVLYAVVQFSEQFVFQIIAINQEMAVKLDCDAGITPDIEWPFRFDCSLRKGGHSDHPVSAPVSP